MGLTREQRRSLTPECFALQARMQLPIRKTPDDSRHTRMAWSQLPYVSGLTDSEREDARLLIIERASELDINLSPGKIVYSLESMSIGMPDVPGHPNRMPFSGVLTRVDEKSDLPPHGAPVCVLIPSAVAESALDTLMGMAIDYTEDFSGHDNKSKIGIITEATITGNALNIAGFLYASDFPNECARIKKEKNQLGFSYECKVAVSDLKADPWVVTQIVFTGAAVLYKNKAAYHSTSLAAKAVQTEKEMEKEVTDAITKLTGLVESAIKGVSDLATQFKTLKAAGPSLTGPVIDQVQPHVAACNACASGMEAAGIGTHPTRGHAAIIRRIATHIAAEAVQGRVPNIYHEDSYIHGAADINAGDKDMDQKQLEAALKPLTDKIEAQDVQIKAQAKQMTDLAASITTGLADLKAAAVKNTPEPPRKTLSPEITNLLTKLGVDIDAAAKGDEKDKLTVAKIDKTLEAAGITGRAAIEAKLNLRNAGLIAA